MTTIADAFLEDILAHPDDDTPRLIFADWLEEEGGDSERAEFIRVQCRMHGMICAYQPFSSFRKQVSCEHCELKRRAKTLIAANDVRWAGMSPPEGATFLWLRGFLAEVECRMEEWMEVGPKLVKSQPIEKVRIRDRRPQFSWNTYDIQADAGESVYRWHLDSAEATEQALPTIPPLLHDPVLPEHRLPLEIFAYLPRPDGTEEQCFASLFTACILWATRGLSEEILTRMRLPFVMGTTLVSLPGDAAPPSP